MSPFSTIKVIWFSFGSHICINVHGPRLLLLVSWPLAPPFFKGGPPDSGLKTKCAVRRASLKTSCTGPLRLLLTSKKKKQNKQKKKPLPAICSYLVIAEADTVAKNHRDVPLVDAIVLLVHPLIENIRVQSPAGMHLQKAEGAHTRLRALGQGQKKF